MNFKDACGNDVTMNDIVKYIENGFEYDVYVGTDSQVKNKKVTFATCIVLHKKSKGGKVFICRETFPHRGSLKSRLMEEVWKSVQVSIGLSQILPGNCDIIVHVDVNKSMKHKSGIYQDELVGVVVGQGFKCFIKPDAWAAQSVADRWSK
jgi:predicted RNase H-related nuclease YkuK (DUF458 family)